jgi:hypothetical protein
VAVGEWCGASGGGRSFSGDDEGEVSGGGDAVWSSREREKGWSKLLPFSYVFFAISFFLKERKKL